MRAHALRTAGVLLAVTVTLGCGDSRTDAAATDTAVAAPAAAVAAADTTGAELWARLQRESYQSWPLWPGRERLYQGRDPHGARLTTYVNGLARDAIASGAATMPAGAIVVKENYGPDSVLVAVTVMEKVPGYDPANRDWFWAKYTANGTIEVEGRAAMCAECHAGAAEQDGLWTLRMDRTGQGPPAGKM